MPTAKDRMLELTSLPGGNTARAHFLSITQTGGGVIIIDAPESYLFDLSRLDSAATSTTLEVTYRMASVSSATELSDLEIESVLNGL